MKILVLFSSRDEQMRETAEYLAPEPKELSVWADVADLHRTAEPDWQNYNSVVIGVPIRYGYYHAAFQESVKKHATRLNSMLSAFYSVNLVARKPKKCTSQANSYVRKFLMNSPWRLDHNVVIAGALLYPRYRWYDRVMTQLIMKMSGGKMDMNKEAAYTDWEQITRFAREIAQLTNKALLK